MEKSDTRRQELLEFVGNEEIFGNLIDEMVFLEIRLNELRKLPMIKVNPHDASMQKVTAAGKLYKDYLQQYTNIVKILLKATGAEEKDEESPLRKWMNEHITEE